jgi:nucleotide-binding universal stress UspA family protein/CheY-like chemotaxis protein
MVKKILVPLDGARHAIRIIEFASKTAMQEDAAVHLVHVVEDTEIPKGVMDYIYAEKIKEAPDAVYLELLAQRILDKAENELKSRGIKDIVKSIISGDPAAEILDYAGYNNVDMIVIGNRGLGNNKTGLGNVAAKVVNSANTTCVIVRKKLLDDKKILIVDDEPDVLETLAEMLTMCEIVKASSFDKAKVLLETQDFDIAILDIMGVDGYKLLEIAKQKKVVPVMLTGHAMSPEDTVTSYRKGAASFVPKDKMADIATYLNDVLEARKNGRHLWWRWRERFGAFFEERFGTEWHKKGKDFLED